VSIQVLSVWQPWASLLCVPDPATGLPIKQYETRSWRPRQGPPFEVAIFATKRRFARLIGALDSLLWKHGMDAQALPRGCVIALATVEEIAMTACLRDDVSDAERYCGDWSHGRYAWRLGHVRALRRPYPLTGLRAGLWGLGDNDSRAVTQLATPAYLKL